MAAYDYDLIVIGGGAGGMAAARSAARGKARVLLVQDGEVGGDCTFTGCVPSKTLIEAGEQGASFGEAMSRVHEAIRDVAATETADVLRGEGIAVVDGRAAFRSPREIEVDGTRYFSERYVVATGARPVVPPIPGLRELGPLTNEDVWDLTERPTSLAVLGGGAIGCELAQAFVRFGTRVSLLEGLDRILTKEEPEVSDLVADRFRRDGIEVRTGSKVTAVEPAGAAGAARLRLEDGSAVEADRVLVAVGRAAVTDGLDLDRAGVATERGFIVTDDRLRTSVDGIWAVGDVAGKLQFTHAADEMGRLAASNAFKRFRGDAYDPTPTPWVTFTSPEVARVGMTEAEAAEHDARVAYLPMAEVDRAVAAGRTEGFVKLVAGPRPVIGNLAGGRLLGATIVCERAGEMIHEAALAMRTRMFVGRLAQTVHAYPTWSMAVQKCASQFFVTYEGRTARPARR